MKYAIVYSSRTGNTRLLAETIRETLPPEECIYFGPPSEAALAAPVLYVGFWTDRGTCDGGTAAFLKMLTSQKIFLFGTAGFGVSQDYFDKILARAGENLPAGVPVFGSFLCQGKMPMSVRQRYESLQQSPTPPPNIGMLIENFDRALSHPDQEDIQKLREAVQNCK